MPLSGVINDIESHPSIMAGIYAFFAFFLFMYTTAFLGIDHSPPSLNSAYYILLNAFYAGLTTLGVHAGLSAGAAKAAP